MVSLSEKEIRLAARLYEARDAMRTIFGESYEAQVQQAIDAIRSRIKRTGETEMVAAMEMAKAIGGHAGVLALAATVEISERHGPIDRVFSQPRRSDKDGEA